MSINWEQLKFGSESVAEVSHTTFTLKDGKKLGIKAWLPCSVENIEHFSSLLDSNALKWSENVYSGNSKRPTQKFPCILEYIPYSKDSVMTLERDYARHPWTSSHGYVVLRVDLRGTGSSEGNYYGEYEDQEFEDCLELINWISKQNWSNGAVGMYGKSWGGFNGLQLAYKQPKALKTIITLYSTDDRYNDDFHHQGNALLGDGLLNWGNFMYAMNARPPQPKYFESLDSWKTFWLSRLQTSSDSFLSSWLDHQHPDDPFWKHASVSQDYSKIQCPVLAIGGLSDGYLNAATRMAGKLNENSKFLLGPWTHNWPDVSVCGPNINFLELCLSWWNHHLKGEPITKEEELPRFSMFLRDSCLSDEIFGDAAGKWVSFPNWQSLYGDFEKAVPGSTLTSHLSQLYLGPSMNISMEMPSQNSFVELHSHALQGVDSGNWFTVDYGVPGDQGIANSHSNCWKSEKLPQDLVFAGLAKLFVNVSAKSPGKYSIQVRICDEFENRKSTLITKGFCNLCYHETGWVSQFSGKETTFTVNLNCAGYTVKPGHRVVVSISPTYFPVVYPALDNQGLMINTKDSVLIFQTTNGEESLPTVAFNKPGPLLKLQVQEISKDEFSLTTKETSEGVFETVHKASTGLRKFPTVGYESEIREEARYCTNQNVTYGDMESKDTIISKFIFGQNEKVDTAVTSVQKVTSTAQHFHVQEHLIVTVNDEVFFENKKESNIPRKYV